MLAAAIFRVVLRETNPANRTEASWKLLEKAAAGGADTARGEGRDAACGSRPSATRGVSALLHLSAGARRQIPAQIPAEIPAEIPPAIPAKIPAASPPRPSVRAAPGPPGAHCCSLRGGSAPAPGLLFSSWTPVPGSLLSRRQVLESSLPAVRRGAVCWAGPQAPIPAERRAGTQRSPQHSLLGAPGASQCVAGAALG